MSVKIRPVGKKLLLKVTEPVETDVGGIIVKGEIRRDGNREAVVRGTGNLYTGDLVAGDRVFIKPYAGTEVKVNGENLVFCLEKEVMAVVDV